MKKNLLYLGLTGYLLFALCTRLQAQTDSLQAHRYVTRATMYGVGFTNVFDTYLSPQEYKGIDFRISRETIRMTKLFDGNVSVQNFFQADVGYTHNRADRIPPVRPLHKITGADRQSASTSLRNTCHHVRSRIYQCVRHLSFASGI